ncbi:MAG: virulence protein SciE type [Pseudomonadota bacterium]|nr:virulence protein SciE type [Pseudomonadota bacterium]
MADAPHDARALLAAGDPAAALKALQRQVRANAADVKLRIFLFQLLCVLGQWPRALDQLKVCAELDAGTLAMVNTYRAAIHCESVRDAVFAGQQTPHVFGPPTVWAAQLAQALQLEAQGHATQAAAARSHAFEAADTTAGQWQTTDEVGAAETNGLAGQRPSSRDAASGGSEHPERGGTPFQWIADADSRLGPVLEVIVNGRYGWLPFMHLRSIEIEPVTDLRDLVWAPAQLELTNGGGTVALLPVRYAGSTQDATSAVLMSRQTEWLGLPSGDQFRGLGQRVLSTDAAEHGLLTLRRISFDAAA